MLQLCQSEDLHYTRQQELEFHDVAPTSPKCSSNLEIKFRNFDVLVVDENSTVSAEYLSPLSRQFAKFETAKPPASRQLGILEDNTGNRKSIAKVTPTETDDNSAVIAVEECRICLDKQISAEDPVLRLGCKCLGDLSCAHQSCIRKWFPAKSVNSGTIACEICMAKLGQEARSIVKIEIRSKVCQYFFQRGLAKITHTIERIIITLSNSVQSLNDVLEGPGRDYVSEYME